MNDAPPTAQEFDQQCLCLNTQRAARALARRYDAALRPAGLTSGQFTMLAALNRPEPVPLTALADQVGLERTTLTRNLRSLDVARLIRSSTPTDDHRVRAVELTAAGRARLRAATPLWSEAQGVGLTAMTASEWPQLRHGLAAMSAT